MPPERPNACPYCGNFTFCAAAEEIRDETGEVIAYRNTCCSCAQVSVYNQATDTQVRAEEWPP